MNAAVAKKASTQAQHVLKRLAQITGAPVRTPTEGIPSFLQVIEDEAFERELSGVRHQLEDLKTRHSAALSHVPPAFVAKPVINFAGYKAMAERLMSRSPAARVWLEQIKQAEKRMEKEADSVALDKLTEDAILNVLVPLERSFADSNKALEHMMETSRTRLDEIKASLAKTEAEIAHLDNATIYDVEADHPDWAKTANDNILHHKWNTIENEHDKDAH